MFVRTQRSVAFRSRTVRDRLVARTRILTRGLRAPADRRRSPVGPVATVREPEFGPAAMARRGEPSYFAGGVRRYATCTGATWTRPDRLVTGFLLGRALVTYAVTPGTPHLRVRHLDTAVEPARLGWVESLAVSPDRRWLAVLDSLAGRCNLLAVDPATGVPDPAPRASCGLPRDRVVHGVTFAADGRSILYSTIDVRPGLRRVPVVDEGEAVRLGPVTELAIPCPDRTPKALACSPDGRWLAIGYGPNVTRRAVIDGAPTWIDIHRSDPSGTIGERVSRTPDAWLTGGTVECVAWTPDGRRLVATDQAGDQALVVAVDPATGVVDGLVERIGWAAGGLRQPHGCTVSPDGRWLAITNYGDGSLRLYRTGP